ncbi:MAG: hypothetical protein KBD90_07090, partial [Alphaproteobacteria bacterium]|nr:hypothetical protein [Alphaproteobacteria bacterium]
MKPNILLSWLCLSTALCTFTHPSWSMKEEDNEIHIQKQKKKASFFSEEDNLKLDIIFVFPEQRGKTLTDLPPAIIGKIGDELKELKKGVHTLKALCRKTRAYVEVYSSHKLVS